MVGGGGGEKQSHMSKKKANEYHMCRTAVTPVDNPLSLNKNKNKFNFIILNE
jgi:hypothetical protein